MAIAGREIIRLHFDADLVTLSACNTASESSKGRSITNLVEAFLVSARRHRASMGVRTTSYECSDGAVFTLTLRRAGQSPLRCARKVDLLAKYVSGPTLLLGSFILVGDGRVSDTSGPMSLDSQTKEKIMPCL